MNHADKRAATLLTEAGRPPAAELDDPRIMEVMEEYLADLEAGRQPDRRVLVARYPELADVLANCLDGLDFVRETAPALGAPAEAPAATNSHAAEHPAKTLGD